MMRSGWCSAALTLSTAVSLVVVGCSAPAKWTLGDAASTALARALLSTLPSCPGAAPDAVPSSRGFGRNPLSASPEGWSEVRPSGDGPVGIALPTAPGTLAGAGAAGGLEASPPDAQGNDPPLLDTAGSAAGASGPLGTLTPLDALPGYRYEAGVTLWQDGGHGGTLMVTIEHSQEPPAQRLRVVFRDREGHDSVRVDEVRVVGRVYSYTGDLQNPWLMRAADGATDVYEMLGRLSWLIDPYSIVGDARPEWSHRERSGGLRTAHSHYGVASLREAWLAAADLPLPDSGRLDVWVSEDHGALVALEINAVAGQGAGSVEFRAQAELRDVGEAVVVREPEACASQELPHDVPVLAGAGRLTEHCGIWTFQTRLTGATVARRYTGLLQDRGWRLLQEDSVPPALLVFIKDGRTVTVRTDDTPSMTYVILDLTVPESR